MDNKNTQKGKKRRASSVIFGVLLVLFASVFLFSAYKIYVGLTEYKKADAVYDDLRDSFLSVGTEDEGSNKGGSGADSDETDNTNQTEQTDEGSGEGSLSVSVDFDALVAYNSDVVGWLYLEGTEMNFPVVQSGDNEYYLRRGLDGKYLVTGTVFADFRCDAIKEGKNYVIYGHDMKNDTIFGMTDEYARQDYYDAHPVIYYLTPQGNYKIEVYTGVVIPKDDRLYSTSLAHGELITYVKELAASSGVKAHLELSDSDALVTLSTCTDEYNGARFVVIGRAVKLDGGEL